MFAKRENGTFYKAFVLKVLKTTYYCMYFEADGGIRNDVRPIDVINFTQKDRHPSVGQLLKVVDGMGHLVDGRQLGVRTVCTYQVRFENDNHVSCLERKDIYSYRETLMRLFCGHVKVIFFLKKEKKRNRNLFIIFAVSTI